MLKKKFCGFFAEFHPTVVFRTPLLPYSQVSSSEEMIKLYQCEVFQEAVYLASPSLSLELDKLLKSNKSAALDKNSKIHKLHKYWIRANSRTTPFGLFAGCGTLQWMSKSAEVILDNHNQVNRQTRLDMSFVCQVVSKISESFKMREKFIFYPNSSIYPIKNRIRYIEYKYLNRRRVYQISSAALDVYLELVLSKSRFGIKLHTLVDHLITFDPEINSEEAIAYINELIDEKILTSHFEPGSTGGDPIEHLIKSLDEIKLELDDELPIYKQLGVLSQMIKDLDQSVNSQKSYNLILSVIESFDIPFKASELFHVVLKKKAIDTSGINSHIQDRLINAGEILLKISNRKNNNITDFATAFNQRYEGRTVPLLEVLDAEIGIGYPVSDEPQIFNSFLEGIPYYQISKNDNLRSFSYDEWDIKLHSVLVKAQHNRNQIIDLEKLLNNEFLSTKEVNPPESLSFRFSIGVDRDGEEIIFIHPSGLSSAINILGRFGESDVNIKNLLLDVAKFERESLEPAVLAEVVHIPQERDVNISLRPSYRQYEIPYMATSGVPENYQINVDDLLVSVINNRVILYSNKLKKEVIPNLSSAHNYRSDTLPVYHFLSSLRGQKKDAKISFSWGAFEDMFAFSPRIHYRGVVLRVARWKLSLDDCQLLLSFPEEEQQDQLHSWRERLGIPPKVTIVKNDAELPFDLTERFSAETFLQVLRKEKRITLQEFIFDGHKSIITDQSGASYCNEFFATLLVDKKSDKNQQIDLFLDKEEPPRVFSLGSEWIFYKIYCSPTTADNIIIEILESITNNLLNSGIIINWFFIRYNDPDNHLRLRFQLSSPQSIPVAIECILQALGPFQKQSLVKNIQTDTYTREIERYGSNTIELCESWFCIDSKYIIKILSHVAKSEDVDLRWLTVLKSVDAILDYFDLSIYQKANLVSKFHQNFKKEFSQEKQTSRSINMKYRTYRKRITTIIGLQTSAFLDDNLNKLLVERKVEARELFSSIMSIYKKRENNVSLESLISSLLHMHMNRYFVNNPRIQELMIYAFLEKHYKSLIARQKLNINAK